MVSAARAAKRHPERHRGTRDVAVAYCRPDQVAGAFCDSLAMLCAYDGARNQRVATTIAFASGPRVSEARNAIVRAFLEGPATWLWMLDADMSFLRDTLDRKLQVTEENPEVKILGGLCFAGGRDAALRPVIYSEPKPGTFELRHDYPEDALVKVAATGAACLLIHRDVAVKILSKHYEKAHPWFDETAQGKDQWGEDITFCRRARDAGYDVYVHTGIEIGHNKSLVFHSELYRLLRSMGDQDRERFEASHMAAMGVNR